MATRACVRRKRALGCPGLLRSHRRESKQATKAPLRPAAAAYHGLVERKTLVF